MKRQLLIAAQLLALLNISGFVAAQPPPGRLAQDSQPTLSKLTILAGAARQAGDLDGVGGAARFSRPSDVDISADGSFALLVEEDGSKLKRIDIASRQVSSITSSLQGAFGVAVSPDQSFALVTSGQRHTVQRIDLATGVVSLLAGGDRQSGSANGIGAAARFNYPTAITISADGSFALVADADNDTVRRISLASREVATIAGLAGVEGTQDGVGAGARFTVLAGLELSPDSSFALITDRGSATIRRIDLATNAVTTIAGRAGLRGYSDGVGQAARFDEPNAIAISASYALISDRAAHTVRQLDLATNTVTTLLGQGGSSGSRTGVGSAARLSFPRGIDISADGSFALLAEVNNQTVGLLNAPVLAATIDTLAGEVGQPGSSDGVGTVARFNRPVGVSSSADGLVLIADSDNHTIRRATLATRTISTLAGAAGTPGSADGIFANARFNRPLGVSINSAGSNALVADTGNHTIRIINLASGTVGTLAGAVGTPGSADGVGAAAQFSSPYAVEQSSSGSFALVVDTGSHTIRRITIATGEVSTLAGAAGAVGSADGIGPAARFNRPVGISLSEDDSFAIIADEGNGAIRKLVLATGAVTTLISGLPTRQARGQLAQFGDVPVLNAVISCTVDTALVSNGEEQTISQLDLRTGQLQPLLGKRNTPGAADGTGENARFNGPSDLASNCENEDTVVVSDTGNQLIRVIDTSPDFTLYLPLARR